MNDQTAQPRRGAAVPPDQSSARLPAKPEPRSRGGEPRRPIESQKRSSPAPHKWAGGHTFEYEFDFHMAVNRHYSDKPAVETKAAKSQEGPAKPKSTTTQDKAAKPTNGERPQRAPLTPYERKERNRKAAAQRRQNRKEQGPL